jgi:phage shock protein PspC (stress-responsive transcriptional regulator)
MKKLTRSNEKLVAGVVGGISNYVNPEMDPVFFRVAFALLTFFNPLVILIYFGMALILPTENISYSK